jgi:hypothetical protein
MIERNWEILFYITGCNLTYELEKISHPMIGYFQVSRPNGTYTVPAGSDADVDSEIGVGKSDSDK